MGNVLKFRDVESEVLQLEQERITIEELEILLKVSDLIEMPKMKDLPWIRVLAPKKGYIDEYQGDRQRFIGYYISENDEMITMIDGCIVVGAKDVDYTLLDESLLIMVGTKLAIGMIDCMPPVIREIQKITDMIISEESEEKIIN